MDVAPATTAATAAGAAAGGEPAPGAATSPQRRRVPAAAKPLHALVLAKTALWMVGRGGSKERDKESGGEVRRGRGGRMVSGRLTLQLHIEPKLTYTQADSVTVRQRDRDTIVCRPLQ